MLTNKSVIQKINKKLGKKTLFYVCRYPERARGLENLLKNYKIIYSIPPQDTAKIIENKKISRGYLAVFKNNAKISRLCREKKIKLINPNWQLAEKYENKISQYQWLKKIIFKNLPKTAVIIPKNSNFKSLTSSLGNKFIAQFNRSHTGEGTFLISNKKDWEKIKKSFPQRQIKCVETIKGDPITVNACVWGKNILVGNPSYQITGRKDLTDFKFSTVGNDWNYADKILSKKNKKEIEILTQKIGLAMAKEGWRGLFGLDFILNNKKLIVIEINARQPASTGLETIIQRKTGTGLTMLAAHFASLLKLPFPAGQNNQLQKINCGGQIIIRKKKNGSSDKILNLKNKSSLITAQRDPVNGKIIKTDIRTKNINAEIGRIQNFNQGFVKNDKEWNEMGKKLIRLLAN
jgi:predicted ATP-grasp superfamily ATP-dependent carboligase